MIQNLVNTVIADNRGANRGSGAFIYNASPRLLHTTIARNAGGDDAGVCVSDGGGGGMFSGVQMTNTIVFSHGVGIRVLSSSAATLVTTLWHANVVSVTGNVTHVGDLDGDPAFAADGYHLTQRSAAVNKGTSTGVGHDIDGDTRPTDSPPDIGADEMRGCVYLPLVLRGL